MEFLKVISGRRSIRRFKKETVPDEMIKALLNAARLAPSGGNCQPWRFVIVKKILCIKQLAKFVPQPFVTRAPLLIVVCVDKNAMSIKYLKERTEELIKVRSFFLSSRDKLGDFTKKKKFAPEIDLSYMNLNVAIAVDHLILRAVDLGLGTCWVMQFDRRGIREVLSLDDRYEPLALLAIGFPAQSPKPRPRLRIKDILIKEI